MSRTLTASDRKRLIRLASTLPKGSSERRTILATIKVAYNLNAGTVKLDEAKEYAEGVFGRPVDEVLPDFDKNYAMLQKKVKQSPAIPRIQMPVIEPNDISEFNDALNAGRVDIFAPYTKGKLVGPHEISEAEDGKWVELGIKDGDSDDDVVKAKMTSVPVGKLKPTQNQIWLEKTFGNIAKFGAPKSGSPVLSSTIIVSSDGYILDGHHRFSQAIMADPSLKMKALVVPMPIKQLLEIGRYYGEAIGNKAKQASRLPPAADRNRLVRLASTLPEGSDARRTILRMARDMEVTERDIQKAKTLSGVDPALAKYIVETGLKDGDTRDDKIQMGKTTVSAGKLKPSQTTMRLDKTLGMAIAMLLGKMPMDDIGAIISDDNHILDGHHRWSAAIAAGGPGVSVGGYKAKLKGADLIKVLNIITKGMFGRNKGNTGSGNIKDYTPAKAKKMLREMAEKGTEFLSSDQVQQGLTRLGVSVEEGIEKMAENIGKVSKAVPSWAPAREQMPVINEKDLPATSQALNTGIVNWNNPLKVQERRAMTRLASTLPKGSSERRTLLAMLKSAAPIGSGKNGYIAMYKGKKVEVMADTKLEARDLAAEHFRARKPYDVTVMLAEKGGKQVTHMPLFASKSASMFPDGVLDDEELDELTPEQRRAWKGYEVSMTYEVWSHEDVEHGDTDDKGWEFQDEHEDTLEDVSHTLSNQSWLEWSTSGHPGKRGWIISQDEEDFRTGDRTINHAFVTRKDGQPLSKAEVAYLNKKLYIR